MPQKTQARKDQILESELQESTLYILKMVLSELQKVEEKLAELKSLLSIIQHRNDYEKYEPILPREEF